MGKAGEGRGGGKAFETRQKIVGFIFVRKASKIDLSRLILLLPEALLKEGRGRGAGGGERRPAGGAGPGAGLAGSAGGGRARQTHSAADVSGLVGLVVFISPTPGCSQTPGQI